VDTLLTIALTAFLLLVLVGFFIIAWWGFKFAVLKAKGMADQLGMLTVVLFTLLGGPLAAFVLFFMGALSPIDVRRMGIKDITSSAS
jgi:uncharacterized membrane protein YwzB